MRALPVIVGLIAAVMLVAAASWVPKQGALGAVPSTSTTSTIPLAPTTTVAPPPTTTTTTAPAATPTTTTTTTTTIPPKQPATVTTTTTTPTPKPAPPTTTTTTTTRPAVEPHLDPDFAAGLFSLANGARAADGTPSLEWSGTLAAHARSWAKRLGDLGDLQHSNFGALTGEWASVGENVAMGHRNASTMHKAWMASSGHRSNILNAGFTHAGVAVWIDHNGTAWAVEVFGG